jgi:hypothetical protein
MNLYCPGVRRWPVSAAVYVAPTILHIDRSANTFVVPSPCPRGRGCHRRRCGKKGGKKRGAKVKIREAGDEVAVAGAATIGVVMILGGAR